LKPSFIWLSAGGLLVTVLVMGQSAIPLGIPEEWEWSRHSFPAGLWSWIDRTAGPACAGLFVLATWLVGTRALQRPRSGRLWIMLPLLFAVSVTSMLGLQSAAPSPHQEVKGHWVIYDRFASGYFAEAAFEIDSARELLSGYEARMRKGDVLHEGTHPPGLYLLNWYALRLTESSPALSRGLSHFRSSVTEQSFRQLEASAAMSPRLTEEQLATLTLVSLITLMTAAAAPLAVFGVTGLVSTRIHAWQAACLTITIPAIIVFYPKSDVVFATTGTLVLLLTVQACVTESAVRRVVFAMAAAAMLFCGMLLSLAHLPAAMVSVVFGLLLTIQKPQNARTRTLPALGIAVLTFAVLLGVWWFATNCNLLTVWRLNLANHAGFYDQYPRTVWKWMLLNPLELALSTGVPLFLTACVAWCGVLRRVYSDRTNKFSTRSASDLLILAIMITICVLWLSGRNSGEAARLWCFMTPWLAISGSLSWSDRNTSGGDALPSSSARAGSVLLAGQICCAVIVVSRVNGFMQL